VLYAADCIPTEAEMKELRQSHQKKRVPVARVYKGMDWAALADDEAFPRLRMAVRGGSSEIAGHGMLDLLSLRCRVNGELMITDQQDGGYMATTFTGRGHEIYGRSSASKSTLFVDGLGCAANAACDKTEVVKGDNLLGIRIDASRAYMPGWKKFIGRLVLMVDNAYWLVIDHVRGTSTVDRHWMESRFHTLADCRAGKAGVAIKSGKEAMGITFAALGAGGVLQQSRGMPSQPSMKQTTIFRWMGREASSDNLHVTALNPGNKKLSLAIRRDKANGYRVEVTGAGGYRRTIGLTSALKLKSEAGAS